MSRPILSWAACGITLLGFSGVASAAYTFDKIDDDFNRTQTQLAQPHDVNTIADWHFHWSGSNTKFAKDASNVNVANSMGILSNGFLTIDMSAAGIASGGASITTSSGITPQTRFYTYEVRLTANQFAGPNGSITIASVRNGYPPETYTYFGWLQATLNANQLDILGGNSINITTDVGKAYTWRFIADQQSHTVDIYRRANDSDPFVAIATNQAYSMGQVGPQATIGANYGVGDSTQPIATFDYVRLGSNAAPIPEPATLGLLGLGGLALLARRRRH